MEKIFKKVELKSGWKKINLKKFNDFYLVAIKKKKNSKKSSLNKDCVKKIKFEIAVDSGKKGKYVYFDQLVVEFKNILNNDNYNKDIASVRALGYPSTFYIRAVDITGETSTVSEGSTSIEVYLNELRLK